MKTPRFGTGGWLAILVAMAVVLTGGCAPSGSAGKDKEASATPPVSTERVETSTNSPTEPAPETVSIVQRSERPVPVLPDAVRKVVELVESGAGDEVVRAYVAASPERFELSLDQIIFLRDIGVGDGVIAGMMRRGSELREKDAEAGAQQTNLLAAVERLKEGLAAGNGPAEEPAPSAPETAAAAAAPPAPASPTVGIDAGQPPVAVQGAAVPMDAPQPVQQFSISLAPYGTWYQVPSYGWVWQPVVVTRYPDWMPYRHGGHWVWTDCGWYWTSDYSWGWAPFHYGRWCTYPGIGWCWVPDTTWGPSWVTWRHCDSHIGWAPLPPACGWASGVGLTWHGSGVSVGFGFELTSACYTFVPYHNFCHRGIATFAVRGDDLHRTYHRSTVVNNLAHGDHDSIVNHGVGYSQVASHVRGEIPKARVHDLPGQATQNLRADRMERGKDGFVVYRPAPVENAGGRPAPIRAEVKPTPPAGGGGGGSYVGPTRPGAPGTGSSRFVPSTPASKPMESRGTTLGSTSGGRPVANPRNGSTTIAQPNASRPGQTTYGSKAPEVRTGESYRNAVNGTGASPTLGPTRQTTPLPLGDPSKNLPSRSAAYPSRTATPSATPGSVGGSTATRPAATATPAPAFAPAPRSAPNPGYSQAAPRPVYSAPAAPAMAPPSRPVAPSAPSPSFSAPAPAPSRPAVSTPAPAREAPSASSSRNGSRGQPN